MKILLTTYPRSGQHYLVDLFKQQLNYDLEYTHNLIIKGYDKYITIIRNPQDCIISWVVMEMHCGPLEGRKELSSDEYINNAIREYLLFYTYLLKTANIIINYNDLIEYPDKLLVHLSLTLGIKRINNDYKSTIHDHVQGRFLKTSTSSNLYNKIKEQIKNYDLSECTKLYNEAMLKSIFYLIDK